jgi:hypothetical protein
MGDIKVLSQAKDAALTNPESFLRDLSTGKVQTEGDQMFSSMADDDDDDSDDGATPTQASNIETNDTRSPPKSTTAGAEAQAWSSLPRPQNVVRCPPINWSQYAVVGESLDKLHADQLARPSEGSPASIGVGGTYEFKGVPLGGDQRPIVGIAAPYTPGKDKLDKKPKGAKR